MNLLKFSKKIVKGPYSRRKVGVGLENIGIFQVQKLVYTVTLVNLTKKKNITNHIGVSVGTKTYGCSMVMDQNTSLVIDCILLVLAHALDIPCLRVVDSIFCEALRWHV